MIISTSEISDLVR